MANRKTDPRPRHTRSSLSRAIGYVSDRDTQVPHIWKSEIRKATANTDDEDHLCIFF